MPHLGKAVPEKGLPPKEKLTMTLFGTQKYVYPGEYAETPSIPLTLPLEVLQSRIVRAIANTGNLRFTAPVAERAINHRQRYNDLTPGNKYFLVTPPGDLSLVTQVESIPASEKKQRNPRITIIAVLKNATVADLSAPIPEPLIQ